MKIKFIDRGSLKRIMIILIILGLALVATFYAMPKSLLTSCYFRSGDPLTSLTAVLEKSNGHIVGKPGTSKSVSCSVAIRTLECKIDLGSISFLRFAEDLQKQLMFDLTLHGCKVFSPTYSLGEDGDFTLKYEFGGTAGDVHVDGILQKEDKIKIIMIFHEYKQ